MGRRKKFKPEWHLSAKDFRLANEWARRKILEAVMSSGAIGITASGLVGMLTLDEGDDVPAGLVGMTSDRRGRLIWRNINRLMDKRVIEDFQDPDNYNWMTLRTVNVLDRMTYALSQEDA